MGGGGGGWGVVTRLMTSSEVATVPAPTKAWPKDVHTSSLI